MKKWILAAILIYGSTMAFNSCSSHPKDADAPDYSQKSCWYKIPEITKEFDTFFIYPTEYMGSNEGDPDYAPLDHGECIRGIHKPVYSVLPAGECNGYEERLR